MSTMPTDQGFGIGNAISMIINVYKRNLIRFSLLSLLMIVVYMIVVAITFAGSMGTLGAMGSNADPMAAFSALSGMIIPFLIMSLVLAVFFAFMQAVFTLLTFNDMSGRRLPTGEAFGQAWGKILPVIGVYVVLYILMFVLYIVAAIVIGGLIAGLGILGGIISVLIMVIGGWYLGAMFISAVPAVIVESQGVFTAIGRAISLSSGRRWSIIGLFLVLGIGFAVVALILMLLSQIPVLGILAGIVLFLFYILMFAFFSVMPAVIYYQLRVSKEGIGTAEIAAVFE